MSHHNDIIREGNDGGKNNYVAAVDDISLFQLQIPNPSPQCISNQRREVNEPSQAAQFSDEAKKILAQ